MTSSIVHCEDCLKTMGRMKDGAIDLVVTSPPYDNMRNYGGYTFDFEPTARELYRVIRVGGVMVWVVGDQTIKGSETGTSFYHALYFLECGFNLETMIWEKPGVGPFGCTYFYGQVFEYMFVLTKGTRFTRNLLKDRKNKEKPMKARAVNATKDENGTISSRRIETKAYGKRHNIWRIAPRSSIFHSAPFPEQLANDHMITWSNKGDLVYDPFTGSGTTGVVAKKLGRSFVGSEVEKFYAGMARNRIKKGI